MVEERCSLASAESFATTRVSVVVSPANLYVRLIVMVSLSLSSCLLLLTMFFSPTPVLSLYWASPALFVSRWLLVGDSLSNLSVKLWSTEASDMRFVRSVRRMGALAIFAQMASTSMEEPWVV